MATIVLAAALGGAGGGAAAARAAADPFYLDLLRDGIQSYDRADYAAATKQLRLACFGMLDEPAGLAACLVRLGLAQAAANESDAFRETFRRIVEVEERFAAYTKAELPATVRAAFEQRVLTTIPAGTLESIAAWRPLLDRKLETQIAALPPRERRHQLEERLAKDPRSVPWNVLLTELDVEEGQAAPAITRAEATATLAPQDPWALCARGLARAAGNRCREALADLEPCPLATAAAGSTRAAGAPGGAGDVRYAAALLGCRVELAQWRQAEEQVRALPPAFRQDRKVAALVQQVAKHPSSAAATPAPPRRAGAAATAGSGSGGGNSSAGAAGATAEHPAAAKAAGATAAPAPGAPGASGTPPGAATPAHGARAGEAPAAGAPGASGVSGARAGAADPAAPGAPAGRPAAPLTAAEQESMARSEKLLTATAVPDLREALRLARQVADAHPEARDAQYLAGEAAYRNSRWSEAATYFRRGGPPGDDRPELLFYMAVAFFEVGDQPAAAAALRRSLPNLQKTPFVESYVKRILGP